LRKIFGKADDFYRARVLTLEEEVMPDFDWRDDILYRAPEEYRSRTKKKYCLQVVELDTRKNQILKQYSDKREANEALAEIEENLKELTKMEFEKKYDLDLTSDVHLTSDTLSSEEAEEEINKDEADQNTNVPRNLS